MEEIRIKLLKLSERVNLNLNVPLMKRRAVRKTVSVPRAAVSGELSICLSVYLCLSVCLSIYLCLSVYLSVYLSMSVCLSIYLSVCLSMSVCLSIYLSVCLSMSVCLSIYLSISVCLFVYVCLSLSIYIFQSPPTVRRPVDTQQSTIQEENSTYYQ